MLKKFLSSELGKGALILFIAINLFNFFNFIFHISMARLLTPSEYGILATLMALISIYAIPSEAIQNIISRYTSQFNVKKEDNKIKFLLNKSLKKTTTVSSILFFVLVMLGFLFSWILQINFWLITITNLFIFLAIITPITRGILQGRKKFGALGINMIIDSSLKLFFAISLVLFGFKVFGAITGALLGSTASLIFAFYANKDILEKKEEKVSFNGVYKTSIPYFITMAIILFSFSLDIILSKIFFSPEIAGQYAGLSMLGKIIFLGTVAIGKAMFPLTSEKHDTNKDSSRLFGKSMIIVIALCGIAILIYGFFPELVIKMLYGAQYLEVAPYLVYSAISLSFLSLSNLIFIYNLSTKKIKHSQFLFIFLIIEIILLSMFHNNLLEYTLAFMVSNTIMFIGSFFFVKNK